MPHETLSWETCFLFDPNKFYNDADSSLSASSFKLVHYCGVRLGINFYLNQINNCPRSIINCKVSACSSSELNLRSPHLRFYLFQIKVQWKWIHLFTQSIPSLPNRHQFRNLYEFYLFQIIIVKRTPEFLGQKQRRNSSDFSVIILFESNNNRPKKPD